MLRFTVKRLINMVFVLFAISVIVFFIFNVLPGGGSDAAAERIAGKNVNQTLVQQIKKDYGFNDPVYTQYCAADEEDDQRRPGVLLQPGQRPRAADRGHPAHRVAVRRRGDHLALLRDPLRA